MRNPDRETTFRFKQFTVVNRLSAMKVGTDGVLLGAWTNNEGGETPKRIFDVGCGTGLIALMMAQRFPSADITAVEIDEASADEAEANFANSPWADRLRLVRGDFMEMEPDGRFDLIVSNPPFFTNGALAPDNARRQARHESTLTIAGLVTRAANMLSPTGKLALIIPADRADQLCSAIVHQLTINRKCLVSTVPTKPPRRLLVEIANDSHRIDLAGREEHISIHDISGNFTKEYIGLTKDFYLNF